MNVVADHVFRLSLPVHPTTRLIVQHLVQRLTQPHLSMAHPLQSVKSLGYRRYRGNDVLNRLAELLEDTLPFLLTDSTTPLCCLRTKSLSDNTSKLLRIHQNQDWLIGVVLGDDRVQRVDLSALTVVT